MDASMLKQVCRPARQLDECLHTVPHTRMACLRACLPRQIFEMQSAQMHQQILQRAGITHEMFTACMMANKDDPTVRQLMGQTLRMGDLLYVPPRTYVSLLFSC